MKTLLLEGSCDMRCPTSARDVETVRRESGCFPTGKPPGKAACMKVCRFTCRPRELAATEEARLGLFTDAETVVDLSAAGLNSICSLLERENHVELLKELAGRGLQAHALTEVRLLAPVERQEVWAAGVTYQRSKKARMEESEFSANAYDRVYDAERPELFFKSMPSRVSGPREPVGIRRDSKWSVPEPELALLFDPQGRVAGYTVGNDMSARDIEGENLLYLPQAKIYDGSCALGPCVAVGVSEEEARTWTVDLRIKRDGGEVFAGQTTVGRIKRRFSELGEFLFRCQTLQNGAVLLTGTGVVPPEDFTLKEGDLVRIEISGIGALENPVRVV